MWIIPSVYLNDIESHYFAFAIEGNSKIEDISG